MKKLLSSILVIALCVCALSACGTNETDVPAVTEETQKSAVAPLPAAVDIKKLDDCTVAVSLEKGGLFADENGKKQMKVTVHTYDLYDMVDIAALEVGDTFLKRGEEIKIDAIERKETGLININGGEENGGFSLYTSGNTVYYEMGFNDVKNYYSIGEITLPVADEFVYSDESDLDAEAKLYSAEELMSDSKIQYHFTPNNAKIVIKEGKVTNLIRSYMP